MYLQLIIYLVSTCFLKKINYTYRQVSSKHWLWLLSHIHRLDRLKNLMQCAKNFKSDWKVAKQKRGKVQAENAKIISFKCGISCDELKPDQQDKNTTSRHSSDQEVSFNFIRSWNWIENEVKNISSSTSLPTWDCRSELQERQFTFGHWFRNVI